IIVVAGTGSNATQEAIDLTVAAEKAGVDASLQVSPYYNRPTQEGLKMHFKMIAESTKLPLVLYNIPGRTGQNIEADTTIELSKIANIVGIKEASGNFGQVMKIIQKTRDNGFVVVSGDDQLTLPMMSMGAKGVISVAANIIPEKMRVFTETLLKGDFKTGLQMHYDLLDLFNIQFVETNPGPIKYMASLLNLPAGGLIPPMTLPSSENKEKIKIVMKKAGLI
nr:4-hydroxy-tetrahydrodipicolinate synthase [Candidatus Sigynarchaeota archaeon]